MQTIVIGHKNPDMDSICSAIGYAELKIATGLKDVTAARAGATNERVDYVLGRFGRPAPPLITDVSPRVSDVMEKRVLSVRIDTPVYDAIQLMEQKEVRALPVVDSQRRCMGLLSAYRITRRLFPPRSAGSAARVVTASVTDLVTTFGGMLFSGVPSAEPQELLLFVGTFELDTMAERLRAHPGRAVVLFVGDRVAVQRLAIESRVHALVITGGCTVDEEIRNEARAAGVPVIGSPHDTATTVLLARGAAQVSRMLDTEFIALHPDMLLDEARKVVADSSAFVFPVLDDDKRLIGTLSKSDFLKPPARQLILVDHNEMTQAVKGADRVPIIEVLDHHKLGGFSSHTPMLFWNYPVGSTCTIVSLNYRYLGVAVAPDIAGILMSGIISDTLNLTSPTTTAQDREILEWLSKIAGVEATPLAEQIFSVGSPLLTMSAQQAIGADCKAYTEQGHRFTVAQIEELTFAHFPEKKQAVIEALEAHRVSEALLFAALLVTDITTQSSLLLVRGADAYLAQIDYPPVEPFIWELAGVVSRKKQLLPYLLGRLENMPV